MLSSGAERYLILVVLLFPWVPRLGRLLRASGRNSPDHVDPPPTLPVGVAGSDAPVRFGPSAWVLALVVGGWAATTAVLASHQNSLAIIPLGWPGGLIVLAVLLQNPSVRADEEGLTVRNSVWPRRIRWSDIAALTAEASTWRMPGRHNSVAG